MEATPVAPQAGTQAGNPSLDQAIEELQKRLRFRAVKRELAELRAEYERLESELFGAGAL